MNTTKLHDLPTTERKIIRAWCMYDWANSAFATSGTAAIFPVYFVFLFKNALGDEAIFLGLTFTGSSLWSLGIAISTAIVALTSPVLGVIADRVAIKKALLWAYTIAGSLFTFLAFFSAYTSAPWAWLFGTFLLGNIGFAGSLVFYNSFLPHIAPRHLLDDVSSRGFAYGYIGGGLLLVVHLALNVITSESQISDLVTRLSIASVGLWWFFWSLYTLRVIPEPAILIPIEGLTTFSAIKLGFSEIGNTFRELRRFKVILLYLCAYLLFNDGIQTVLGIAGAFAADTLGIPLVFNMATILIIQFVAAGGAMAFSRLSSAITTKKALTVSLIGWIFIVLFGVAIAPLIPPDHQDHDYQLEFNQNKGAYTVTSAPELGDSRVEKLWVGESGQIISGDMLSVDNARSLISSVGKSRNSSYSISALKGPLDNERVIGGSHPSTLGSGTLDWWPSLVRKTLWAPLGIKVVYQWLLLGLAVGVVMGGSQALSRSLFAQISPETRSGEFFSFFGFISRASSVFGPMLYIFVTGILDTRSAIFSILLIIVAGTIVLKWVDVDAGSRVAREEDQRIRKSF